MCKNLKHFFIICIHEVCEKMMNHVCTTKHFLGEKSRKVFFCFFECEKREKLLFEFEQLSAKRYVIFAYRGRTTGTLLASLTHYFKLWGDFKKIRVRNAVVAENFLEE